MAGSSGGDLSEWLAKSRIAPSGSPESLQKRARAVLLQGAASLPHHLRVPAGPGHPAPCEEVKPLAGLMLERRSGSGVVNGDSDSGCLSCTSFPNSAQHAQEPHRSSRESASSCTSSAWTQAESWLFMRNTLSSSPQFSQQPN